MPRALLLSVRFHDGRYHGRPEWPPSPARFFQALVSGAAKGETLLRDDSDALAWLERLAPPVIVAPPVRTGSGFRNYVPNNDLDAVGGDPRRIAEIRAPKLIKPLLFDPRVPLLYAWHFEEGEQHARTICAMAERLYQLGRGVDMAWAWGEIIESVQLEDRILEHGGTVYRPCKSGEGQPLLCPQRGALKSLEIRFGETSKRFSVVKSGQQIQQLFSQAPKPRFANVAYDSPRRRFLFDLRDTSGQLPFVPWPLTQASQLVESVRDCAAQRLKRTLPEEAAIVERVFIGRNATEADKAARIRIIPLPSIGSPYVVRSIRRILLEVPANCPLPADDLAWSFSALDLNVDHGTGKVLGDGKPVLVPAEDWSMLRWYGVDEGQNRAYRVWRTMTPAVLPEIARRRRIDPARLQEELTARRSGMPTEFNEAKPARERLAEENRAVFAVAHALRHAGVSAFPQSIRLQREPFDAQGERAEAFARGTRFAKERLWHVEIVFAEPQRGPLVIGDGRYLGLGVMAPLQDAWREVMVFAVPIDANIPVANGPVLLRAVRRALMALARDAEGRVPRLFSGHGDDGGRAASGFHEHVFLAADDDDGDGRIDRLVVAAPWVCDRTARPDRRMRRTFDEVVSRLRSVRAGSLGVISLGRPVSLDHGDPLLGPARVWQSQTLYRATRHAGRRKDPATALVRDVVSECLRRGLPRPEVKILQFSVVPNGGGLVAQVRLHFAAAVRGPLLLGRDSHKGGGLFAAEK